MRSKIGAHLSGRLIIPTNFVRLAEGLRLGSYEVMSPVGAGGMGEVYRARDTKLGREVALKVLPAGFAADAERMERFEREAKVLASLNHPNIATIHGLEDSGGTRALVMELVEGPTLADRIAKGPIPLEEALGIARQIAEALEYAHERGIVHRDLKPANIKVTPNEAVKILDFGLAKALEGDPGQVDISSSPTISRMATQAGIILGTAAYMSPEQAKGKTVDRRADIWAFGCVLYEMLTGKQAFSGETVTDTLAAVIRAEPDWSLLPANTPAAIRNLLQRCLKKDPRRRLQSIGDARIVLEEIVSGTAAQYGPSSTDATLGLELATRVPRWRRALPWALGALMGALLMAALASLYFLARSNGGIGVTKLDVSPPSGVAIVSRDSPSIAISRDGTELVFTGTKDHVTELYIRSLDQPQARPIAGTENGISPFFSPDGKWIGFFAEGKLKKIPVDGGTAITLCAAPNQRGGTWESDGSIIFSPDFAAGLMQISESGGQPQQIIAPDESKGERTYRWPEILPNGKDVIFTIGLLNNAASYDDAEIGVYSFREKKIRVVAHGGMGLYSPPGYLVVSRMGRISAVRFNEDSLETSGQSVLIPERVSGDPTSGAAYLSVAANGTMAYLSGTSNAVDSVVAIENRTGQAHIVASLPPGAYAFPRFSPDGKHLALIMGANRTVGQGDIWIYDFGTGSFNRLTFDGSDDYALWSLDGSEILFNSSRDAGGLYLKRSDGSGDEQFVLASHNGSLKPDAWLPHSKVIAFTRPTGTSGLLSTLALGGNAAPKLFKTNAGGAVFSPDGKFIAYTSQQSGVYQVFVNTFPDTGGQWQVSLNGGAYPKWCKAGRELIYYDYLQNRMMEADVDLKPSFHAAAPRVLFNLSAIQYSAMQTNPAVNYDVSADGEKFVFLQPAGVSASPAIALTLNFPAEVRSLLGSRQ